MAHSTVLSAAGFCFALLAVPAMADTAKKLGRFERVGTPAFSLGKEQAGAAEQLAVRAFDESLRPKPNVSLTYVVPSSCGTFDGASRKIISTGPDGVGTPPPFVAGSLSGICAVRVEATEERAILDFSVHIFAPEEVSISIAPTDLETTINSVFSATATLLGPGGIPLPGLPIDFVVRPDGVAGASLDRYSVATNAMTGEATVNVLGNEMVGFYRIVARAAGSEAALGVQQRGSGSNNPGPARSIAGFPPTRSGNFVALLDANTLSCGFTENRFLGVDSPEIAAPPINLRFPHGIVKFATSRCSTGREVRVTMLLPQVVPPGAAFWRYGPTPGNAQPHWYPQSVTVNGNVATLRITDGGEGDEDGLANDSVKVIGGMAFVDDATTFQDIWWAGTTENGWGVSIFQQGTRIWLSFFVYDANGKPIWYVSNGALDASGRRYSGTLLRATGAPFFAYNPAQFQLSNAGTVNLEFDSNEGGRLDFNLAGVATGSKSIVRQRFGPSALAANSGRTGLFWGGAGENGWGLSIHEQMGSLFVVWFTYGEDGNPIWLVAPTGRFNSQNVWIAPAYRTKGSPWAMYDRSKFDVEEVGSFQLRFSGDSAAVFEYFVGNRFGAESLSRQPF